MNAIKICTLWLAVLSATIAADKPPATGPAPAPTQDEIVRTFESKNYAAVLQQITRVLPLKGTAAAGYDRYELLTLKGESHLQLRQLKSAGDAFLAAAKETDDAGKAATARATQYTIKQSKGGKIQRRIPRKSEKLQSADLVDPDQRKSALRIAYEDAQAEAEPKVKAALKSRSVKEIADTIVAFGELHDLELAATGGDAQHLAMRRELGDRAKSLINKQVEHAQKDVAEIRERANSVVQEKMTLRPDAGGSTVSETGRRVVLRGLSDKDRADLKEAIETCRTMFKTAKSLAKELETDPAEIDDLSDRAQEIVRTAERH